MRYTKLAVLLSLLFATSAVLSQSATPPQGPGKATPRPAQVAQAQAAPATGAQATGAAAAEAGVAGAGVGVAVPAAIAAGLAAIGAASQSGDGTASPPPVTPTAHHH